MILGRQHGQFDYKRYGPCAKCYVWIKQDKTMYRHQLCCPAPSETDSHQNQKEIRIASLMEIGRLDMNASTALTGKVFTIMRYDNIGQVAQSDTLLIALGNLWLTKNVGNNFKRKYYTSGRMRDSARLLINMRKQGGHPKFHMSDFLVTGLVIC